MEELIRIAEEHGIDIEDLIIIAIRNRSNDPSESIRLRIELAEKFITEAKERLNASDVMQASEKAYKAAEEIIKALAEKLNTKEYQLAIREGRWYTYYLSSVASIYDWSRRGWSSAYLLHVWGFHENRLDSNSVREYIKDVEEMIIKAKEELLK
ncbi:PaREP1 family protein [Caldivirga sp. UBA161]|uniref:PaREP1 family protein n=1 Tax=Caldivirga sp. UBA161 TaxID=1915569 RepID=UPI0025BC1AA6|nr:PaREP1 family protein [Caldivirga sp. UBA161]